ncbi:hypothetical protein [Mucilaginibacter sp. OK283]|uniref:hypothetical protein n=1 Tax=Mucilaginibacter sp. OK283 TaxID=1881049 RepID=UPI0008CDF91F|nr:hypothetical protein [Mucilaginibacter sp. OK283]SEO51039.1 hypothetical protein SAMN05428947_102622 [Mucilaginibacter sp. OK283]
MGTNKPLPFFFISQELADQRTSAFLNEKNNLLSNAIGKPDTRSIWYSRDHIAGLLEEIDFAGGDGLRIFLGMYEATHPNFANQLCLIMNPTRAVQAGEFTIHENVILENEPEFLTRSAMARGGELPLGENLFNPQKGFNLGSPCPPICD